MRIVVYRKVIECITYLKRPYYDECITYLKRPYYDECITYHVL